MYPLFIKKHKSFKSPISNYQFSYVYYIFCTSIDLSRGKNDSYCSKSDENKNVEGLFVTLDMMNSIVILWQFRKQYVPVNSVTANWSFSIQSSLRFFKKFSRFSEKYLEVSSNMCFSFEIGKFVFKLRQLDRIGTYHRNMTNFIWHDISFRL